MKQLFLWLIVILGLVMLIIYGLTAYNEAAAHKAYAQGQARAMVIAAQGQARLDAAQANAINQGAMLPYVVLGLSVLIVCGGITVLLILKQAAPPAQHIIEIETRTIILLQPGQSRSPLFGDCARDLPADEAQGGCRLRCRLHGRHTGRHRTLRACAGSDRF